ncbi:MAG TPA: aromatic amino acid lyase, partial [Gaiellaceae bacterium]|nr:aromatic amino acid lyase [Gaiellaceae bacterium]
LSARRLREMVQLGEALVAVELVVDCQAVDLRRPAALGTGTARAHAMVRDVVPFLDEGDTLVSDLEPLQELIRSGALSA